MQNFYDNKVYITCNTKIQLDDLEFIILLFQNEKHTGGGDMLNYKLNSQRNMIEINYVSNESKQEVLKRKYFTYQEYYYFQSCDNNGTSNLASDFIDISEYDRNFNQYSTISNTLVIENINKNEDSFNIELYINYLVPMNPIKNVSHSNIYENVIYVIFENDIDFTLLKQKYQEKSTLRNKEIKYYQAYSINSLLVKLNSTYINDNLKHNLDKYFKYDACNNNSFTSHWQIAYKLYNDLFIIVKFSNNLAKYEFLDKHFTESYIYNNIFIEHNYNLDLLNSYLNRLSTRVSSLINNNVRNIVDHDNLPQTSSSASKTSETASTNTDIFQSEATSATETEIETITIASTTDSIISIDQSVDQSISVLSTTINVSNDNNDDNDIIILSDKRNRTDSKFRRKRISGFKRVYYCNKCPFKAPFRSYLFKHSSKTHVYRENAYKCRFCFYFVKRMCLLRAHERLHIKNENN